MTLDQHLQAVARFAVGMGALNPDPIADKLGAPSPAFIAGVNETARILHCAADEEMQDAFGSLLQAVAALADFEDNPDDHLAALRLPQTAVQADRHGDYLNANVGHWTDRLAAMAAKPVLVAV